MYVVKTIDICELEIDPMFVTVQMPTQLNIKIKNSFPDNRVNGFFWFNGAAEQHNVV